MTHEHGNEFQVRITNNRETEELSGWMNGQEAITGLRWSPDKAYWLRVRNIRCLHCLHRELAIIEFPLNLATAENTCFPPRTEGRRSASSRTSSAGA
jgi:hypothetical protein